MSGLLDVTPYYDKQNIQNVNKDVRFTYFPLFIGCGIVKQGRVYRLRE